MSETQRQYLKLLAKAALLKERYQNGNTKNIMTSTSFLAEDYRLCVDAINALIPELYKEHYEKRKFDFIQGRSTLRRGYWRRNPSIRKREDAHQRSAFFEPA